MIVLVLNCGSSSIKYQVLRMEGQPKLLCKGLVERVGKADSVLEHSPADGRAKVVIEEGFPTHAEGINRILSCLVDNQVGVLKSLDEIQAVGHRVAHGGSYFGESALVTPEVEKKIEECCELAPLHNPANLMGIKAMQGLLAEVPQVAVFDTAFHQSLPEEAYLYALPNRFYTQYKVRKYGFHGTSHRYVAEHVAAELGRPLSELRIITCHLGNGASVTAIRGGKSVETSMGFTPVDGLEMGTRCGDVDPGALLYIAEKEELSYEGLNDLINKQSGVLGVSGVSHDMRDCTEAAEAGNRWAQAARKLFAYRVRKYIAQYLGVLEGCDAIVFTGGVGEHDKGIRDMVCSHLEYMGVGYDAEANGKVKGTAGRISREGSRVAVWVIPTNEELVIARDTLAIAKR